MGGHLTGRGAYREAREFLRRYQGWIVLGGRSPTYDINRDALVVYCVRTTDLRSLIEPGQGELCAFVVSGLELLAISDRRRFKRRLRQGKVGIVCPVA